MTARGRSGLSVARENLRSQLWPVPAVGVGFALLLGEVLPRLDHAYDGSLSVATAGYLFGGDADAARSVLSAISGSLITVTSLTFSLTVVTLQLASGQFSPRLLRSFVRDRLVHGTLALFLGTFTYSLSILRSVRSQGGSQEQFVPRVAVSFAFLLAVASIIGLVLFLAHLVRQIRVETMLRNTHDEASATARRVLPDRPSRPGLDVEPAGVPLLVMAVDSGFLVRVDEGELLQAALDLDAVIRVDVPPGGSLIRDVPVASVWSLPGGAPHPSVDGDAGRRIASALRTGFERTSAQDIGFGLRQLTDVALKALSPGINDPTTAVHALGHSSALLCEFAGRDLSDQLLHDDRGRVRVILTRPSLAALLDLVVNQPCHYGAADAAVMRRVFQLLRELAWCVSRADPPFDQDRDAVLAELSRVWTVVSAQDFDQVDMAELRDWAESVRRAAAGSWGSPDASAHA